MIDNQIDWVAVAEFLESAKARIADPVNWCTKDFAQSVVDGRIYPIAADDPRACRFCAVGAFNAEYHLRGNDDVTATARQELYAANARMFESSIYGTNDWHGHVAVMGVYDEAIKVARTKAKEAIAA